LILAHPKIINNATDQIQSAKSSVPTLVCGDFFITKHSNLLETQLVFHLISDEPKVPSQSSEVSTERILLALKNILYLSYQFDITTLTLPLFLLKEMKTSKNIVVESKPQQPDPIFLKRADVISRLIKNTVTIIGEANGGICPFQTFRFVLPESMGPSFPFFLASLNRVFCQSH